MNVYANSATLVSEQGGSEPQQIAAFGDATPTEPFWLSVEDEDSVEEAPLVEQLSDEAFALFATQPTLAALTSSNSSAEELLSPTVAPSEESDELVDVALALLGNELPSITSS